MMPRKMTGPHAGQANSAPRKRRIQFQRRLRRRNIAQTRQDQVQFKLVIAGLQHWTEAFRPTVSIVPDAVKIYGETNVSIAKYFRVNSDLNRVSLERTVLSALLTLGYKLEELEVEFKDDQVS